MNILLVENHRPAASRHVEIPPLREDSQTSNPSLKDVFLWASEKQATTRVLLYADVFTKTVRTVIAISTDRNILFP